jgi:hypothetical protein
MNAQWWHTLISTAKTVRSMVQQFCPHVSVVLGDVIDIGEALFARSLV